MAQVRVCVGVRRRAVPFEAPGCERRAMRAVQLAACDGSSDPVTFARPLSVSVADPRVFQFIRFALSPEGVEAQPGAATALIGAIQRRAEALAPVEEPRERAAAAKVASWTHGGDAWCQTVRAARPRAPGYTRTLVYVALVTFRPSPLLPLCWPSARRAVRLVHGVVALVTANAYISTLGGGHFLCRHLDRAALLARMQMAVSVGLQDPVLESKCRVNLAYNALQAGRFRRARRIIDREAHVAEALGSDELRKVCHAAEVYLAKTQRLHREFQQRSRAALLAHTGGGAGGSASTHHLHDNFYRQRIVKLRAK